jgi:isoquinoline 1-oxidoreductase subunit beta
MFDACAIRPSRRAMLQGTLAATGAFVLGTFIAFPRRALAERGPAPGVYDPNVFLKIAADNSVTLLSKHFEMGQGVTTGLATLVAEELGADWSTMRFEFAPNNAKLYNNLIYGPYMTTGGSTSMAEAWVQMREVGAAARMMFVAAAAEKWKVRVAEISVEKGIVVHPASNRRVTLGELAADAMRVPVPERTAIMLKPATAWKLIGTRVPRLDSVMKTTGAAMFSLDMRRPGMLTAVVRRADVFGATVASFDAADARKVDGVVDVVQVPSGVAVYAKDTWSAMRGRDALKIEWDTSKAELRSTLKILEEFRQLVKEPGIPALRRGDADTALARAAKTVEAEFTFPYLAHAPMEPLNGVIELRPDGAEIWAGSQLQSVDEYLVSRVLGMKPEQIKINTLLGGGSFGRRGNPTSDWTQELAAVAKAINGRAPVHLVWTREDDIKGGFYRPMGLHNVKAGVDAQGRIAGWQHKIICKSIFSGTLFEQLVVKNGVDASSVEGVVDTSYAIADFAVDAYNAKTAVPVMWWRSVGHTHSGHVVETVVDMLAHLAQVDPVAFRLRLLASDPRATAVLRLAAEKAGWTQPLPKGRGRGVAYHETYGTRVAMVAEVSGVGPANKGEYFDRSLKVDRIVAAVDCGVAINPDIVTAQVEGAIGFALSSVLRNQVTLNDGMVEQSNFDDYEPTRMREMPKVEVHIVRSTQSPTGIGEPGVPPVAPAIGNAIAAANGVRLRSLPLNLTIPAVHEAIR